jgi:hypothetical protein
VRAQINASGREKGVAASKNLNPTRVIAKAIFPYAYFGNAAKESGQEDHHPLK